VKVQAVAGVVVRARVRRRDWRVFILAVFKSFFLLFYSFG
jgi:hypothetical protein